MPGYVIHVAIAQEYLKKHKNSENIEEFVKGTIAPDLVAPKSLSHYGKSPAFTNLKEFLLNNKVDTSYKKGFFLHLIADYLFYNHYLERISKEVIHNDYDLINKDLIEKYNVKLPENIKDKVYFKEGEPQILDFKLACKVIDDVSSYDMVRIENEVKKDDKKWNTYKNNLLTSEDTIQTFEER